MRVFHYSVEVYLEPILMAKRIKLSTGLTPRKKERAVWFSTNPVWEETANKMIGGVDGPVRFGDKFETYNIGKGLIRIEISPDSAPYNWENYKRISRVSPSMAMGLEMSALDLGANCDEWHVSFKAVKQDKWLGIETFNWERQAWEKQEGMNYA